MNHIINDNSFTRGLVMICEDDVKFIDNFEYIFNKMINKNTLKSYNIDFKKPLLIRCERRGPQKTLWKLTFTKNIRWSNACFLVNKRFAISFIANLKKICHTSDIYIHNGLLKIDKSIQHLTIDPAPAYQLSQDYYPIFKSKIRNRNNSINNIIEKIDFKLFLCIGHPRCGTTSIAYYLSQMGYDVGHENMGEHGVSSWMLAVNDIYYPWGNIQNREKYYFDNIIHVIRNPFNAIPSIILENKHSTDNKSYVFRKKHIKNILNKDLHDNLNNKSFLVEVETAILTYIYWNLICEKYNGILCKIEDISPIMFLNINNNYINLEKKNVQKLYQNKWHNKPHISLDLYKQVNPGILEMLKNMCIKYNYEYII